MQLWPPQLLVASCGLSSCRSHPSRQRDKGLFSACPLQPPGSVGAEQQLGGSVTDQLRHSSSLGLSALSGKWGQSICLLRFQRGKVTEIQTSQHLLLLRVSLLRDPSASKAPPFLTLHLASPSLLSSAQPDHPSLWSPPSPPDRDAPSRYLSLL